MSLKEEKRFQCLPAWLQLDHRKLGPSETRLFINDLLSKQRQNIERYVNVQCQFVCITIYMLGCNNTGYDMAPIEYTLTEPLQQGKFCHKTIKQWLPLV